MKFNDYWNLPKNVKNYFSPKQEKDLKEKYGKLYTLHTILSIVIVLMPLLFIYVLLPVMFLTRLHKVAIYWVQSAVF